MNQSETILHTKYDNPFLRFAYYVGVLASIMVYWLTIIWGQPNLSLLLTELNTSCSIEIGVGT